MQDYHNIQAWQKALARASFFHWALARASFFHWSHELTLQIYKTTKTFPKEEMYGLTSQMRRAASSIPINIAEGCGRASQAELARFLDIASGSASELDYQLQLAADLGLIDQQCYEELFEILDHIRKMLTSLTKSVRATNNKQRITNNE